MVRNRPVEVEVSFSKLWVNHENRRTYDGVVFIPTGCVPGAVPLSDDGPRLNLFRGFSIDPIPGDWTLLRTHIFDNICQGNIEHYRWLMAWLAHMVQHPDKKPGTAIGLHGKKGVGKSKLAQWVRRLMVRNSMIISKRSQLLGKHNNHLAQAIFVAVEEAIWAGDKEAEAALKELITGDVQMVEPKFVDAFPVPNHCHLMMISNELWFAPASVGERRFFVLEVGDAQMQNTVYFAAIDNQMKAGGLEAMLHELATMEIAADINLRKPPKTAGLVSQIAHSLRLEAKWIQQVLTDAEIVDKTHGSISLTLEDYKDQDAAKKTPADDALDAFASAGGSFAPPAFRKGDRVSVQKEVVLESAQAFVRGSAQRISDSGVFGKALCAIRAMTTSESCGWRPVNPEHGDHRIRSEATS